jgi:hypothetical protein
MSAITGFERQMPAPGKTGNTYTCTDTGAVFTDTGSQWTLVVSTTPKVPTTIYSAAGTPLPAATTALKGAKAVVSDATTPTYMAAYVSGGAVVVEVFCNGVAWVTN